MYRGRFAPSPTGPLHFGSLVAALASYLDARAAGGEWLVRMEDLDAPRTVAGADSDILHTLERFGFEWDGAVIYQSQRLEAYQAGLDQLRRQGVAYPCTCSRREIAGSVYPGTCRDGVKGPERPRAWRVRADGVDVGFEDRLLGTYRRGIGQEAGDFVVMRSDGLFAYQLAVVVDDDFQGITDIVRGADLLDSTPRQIYLQRLLRLPQPRYLHIPVVTNDAGEKLSKQALAPALRADDAIGELRGALRFLGQAESVGGSPGEILGAAVRQWDLVDVPRCVGRVLSKEILSAAPSSHGS